MGRFGGEEGRGAYIGIGGGGLFLFGATTMG